MTADERTLAAEVRRLTGRGDAYGMDAAAETRRLGCCEYAFALHVEHGDADSLRDLLPDYVESGLFDLAAGYGSFREFAEENLDALPTRLAKALAVVRRREDMAAADARIRAAMADRMRLAATLGANVDEIDELVSAIEGGADRRAVEEAFLGMGGDSVKRAMSGTIHGVRDRLAGRRDAKTSDL